MTGIWHGANVTFLIWGLMYFFLLSIEKITDLPNRKGIPALKWVYTTFFVVIGWIFFRANYLSDALIYLKSAFGLNGNPFSDGLFRGWFEQNIILLLMGSLLSTPIVKRFFDSRKENRLIGWIKVLGLCALFVLSIASLVNNSYNPFIYFNF